MSNAGIVKLAVPVSESDHMLGPSNASVTVVNYGDYQCSDCAKRHRQIEKLFDELLTEVRFIYRHFPLVNVHPQALRAAEAAEAAGAQDKFWEMHRRLYFHGDKLGDRDLRRHAREIGLDLDRYDSEMENSTYAARILKDYYDSMVNGITGTPTTFINGVLYAMGGGELITTVKKMVEDQRDFR